MCERFTTAGAVGIVLGMVFAVAGCSTNAQDGGSACRLAGGNCYLPDPASKCIELGPEGCQNPAAANGLYCCIAFAEGGAPVDAGGGG